MAIINGWLNWAEVRSGPSWKIYETVNQGAGIVWHSMEGWYEGSMTELDKPSRQASWMFSIKTDGTLVQHYPVTASCWASGNSLANTQWWSVELEGVYTVPINTAQLATARKLTNEWKVYKGLQATREGNLWTKTMWEHREVDTIATPNAGETACPSERYQPLWRELAVPSSDETLTDLIKIFGGPEKIRLAASRGMDFLLGYELEQLEQNQLQVEVNSLNNRLVALERQRDAIAQVLAQ